MAFLDYSGLSHFLDKIKEKFLSKNQGSTNAGKFMKVDTDGSLVPANVPDPTGKADKVSGAVSGNFAGLDSNGNLTDSGKKAADFILATAKGANNGVAELDSSGKVPTSQLPSYVDDVVEAASQSAFPSTGETGKIYVALDTNKTYRWSGSAYVEISESLALGETSSTAYRGDRGADAYAAAVTNVDSTPTANSTHLITSGGVAAALPGTMTGATSSTNGASGLVPAPVIADKDKFLRGDGSWNRPVVVLTYGVSTYTDFENAFNAGAAIYCRATTDTSDQTLTDYCRYANLSYVNSNPSLLFVEFMYYRTTNPTSSAYNDEILIYKLTGEGVWSTTKRYASLRKIQVSGNGLSVGWDNNIVTLTTSPFTGATSSAAGASGMVPAPTTSDQNKFLKGDGTWTEVNASGSAFTDIAFSIATTDWTLTNGEYVAEVTDALISNTAGIDVFYDKSLRMSAKSDVFSEKGSGKVTFSTDIVPTGALSGTIRIFDGAVPLTPTSTMTLMALASGWSNATPSTQTLSANGVTATNNIIVGMSSVTVEQKEACEQANILCTAQGANSITLTAYGTVPSVNIPINVMIVG